MSQPLDALSYWWRRAKAAEARAVTLRRDADEACRMYHGAMRRALWGEHDISDVEQSLRSLFHKVVAMRRQIRSR